jgi:N-alpha-acetyl-L-2,4-diaminobutyrate deacetylase
LAPVSSAVGPSPCFTTQTGIMIAPLADFVLDLHSGGKTLTFLPFAAAHALPDKDQQARCEAAMEAFGAPYSLLLLEDTAGMYDNAAEAMGKVFVSTELGGGGTATAEAVAIARRGIRNLLVHAGILKAAPAPHASIRLAMPDADCYVISESAGLLEMCVDLGATVRKGERIARIYDTTHTGGQPIAYRAGRDGLLTGRHVPGLIDIGDVIAVVAVPF